MHDVKVADLLGDALEQNQVMSERIDAGAVEAEGAGTDGHELRRRLRVAGGEQRHVVPLPYEFLS
jgi:hypothetical protein